MKDLMLAIYVIKKFSTKDTPLSTNEIKNCMNRLVPGDDTELYNNDNFKAILRKLINYSGLTDIYDELIGGKICHTQSSNGPKAHHFFYFEPLASAGDIDLLNGTIESNRFLSIEEKKYLHNITEILDPYIGDNNINALKQGVDDIKYIPPKRPATAKNSSNTLPVDSSVQLHNINVIHTAIQKKCQLEIEYGYYNTDSKKARKITFTTTKKRVINPYALLWNNGHYYLICTYENAELVRNLRVDRIATAVSLSTKREVVPESLKPFFSKQTFDVLKYASAYPLMLCNFDGSDKIDAVLECTSMTLSLVIDAFGSGIEAVPSTVPHDKNVKDYNGFPVTFLNVRIKNVQYKNILLFCLQNMISAIDNIPTVMALYPPKLVDDIRARIENISQYYDDFSKKVATTAHPFLSNTTLEK